VDRGIWPERGEKLGLVYDAIRAADEKQQHVERLGRDEHGLSVPPNEAPPGIDDARAETIVARGLRCHGQAGPYRRKTSKNFEFRRPSRPIRRSLMLHQQGLHNRPDLAPNDAPAGRVFGRFALNGRSPRG